MGEIVEIPFLQDELRDLVATNELWELPSDTPMNVAADMPGEEDVATIFEGYFGKRPPEGWNIGLARAMVNVGRKRKYLEWKEGR
jgi:hypothetical protein